MVTMICQIDRNRAADFAPRDHHAIAIVLLAPFSTYAASTGSSSWSTSRGCRSARAQPAAVAGQQHDQLRQQHDRAGDRAAAVPPVRAWNDSARWPIAPIVGGLFAAIFGYSATLSMPMRWHWWCGHSSPRPPSDLLGLLALPVFAVGWVILHRTNVLGVGAAEAPDAVVSIAAIRAEHCAGNGADRHAGSRSR
jgi:hypothetical protein